MHLLLRRVRADARMRIYNFTARMVSGRAGLPTIKLSYCDKSERCGWVHTHKVGPWQKDY